MPEWSHPETCSPHICDLVWATWFYVVKTKVKSKTTVELIKLFCEEKLTKSFPGCLFFGKTRKNLD